MQTLPIERRQQLCEVDTATLNGQRARITGYRNDFATVRNADGLSAEWSWLTVEHIVTTKAARFKF